MPLAGKIDPERERMDLGRYTGQFLWMVNATEDHGRTELFEQDYVWRLVDRAGSLLADRTLTERHEIAVGVEATILKAATDVGRRDPLYQGYVEASKVLGATVETTRVLVGRRRSFGDVDLWLSCGAEAASVWHEDLPKLPAGVTRAECLAVIALWKAIDLGMALRQAAQQGATHAEVLTLIEVVGHLGAEATRAATLALDTHQLDQEISRARDEGAAEREKALEEVRDRDVRTNGAKGGESRAAKYRPLKTRAIELYRASTGHRSRAEAAREIVQVFHSEGRADVKYEFILKTLADHDKGIEADRRKPKT